MKNGTATGWTVGQTGEVFAIIARALGKSLEGRDPKDVLEKLSKRGWRLTVELSKILDEIVRDKEILKLLTSESLEIEACDGTEIIAEEKNLFSAGIDSSFRNWGVDEKGPATDAAKVSVYDIVENATLAQMFAFLSENLAELCLTQAQIIRFIKKYRQWLRADGCATLFPFKSKGNFFVAYVYVHPDDSLGVHVYRAEYSLVRNAEYRNRLVVPCLPPACR